MAAWTITAARQHHHVGRSWWHRENSAGGRSTAPTLPDSTVPALYPDGIIFHSFYGQPQTDIALERIARLYQEDPLPTPASAAQRALDRRRTLLVFDGAEQADDLPAALGVCAGQTVLVTSRRPQDSADPGNQDTSRPLSALAPADAVAVVQAWGGSQPGAEETVRRICQLVGHLPLALRISGRYLALHPDEAEDYLSWLQASSLDALDQGKRQQESVLVLLERTAVHLSADARQMLTALGLLAAAPFERTLLSAILAWPEGRTRRALDTLYEYGLLTITHQHYEVSHALIHTYARSVLLARD